MPRRKVVPTDIPPDEPGTLTIDGAEKQKLPPVPDDEPEEAPAKPAPKPRGRPAAKDKVSADDVTTLTVTAFGLVAHIRNREYWQVTPNDCRDWAAAAAELVNNMPKSVTKRIANGTNAGAVLLGLGGLVMQRMQMDAIVAANAKEQAAQARRAAQGMPTNAQNGAMPAADIDPATLFTYEPAGL